MSRLGNLAKVGLGGALGVAATNSDAAGQTFEALFKAPSLATLMGLAGIATQRQIAAPAPGGFDPVVMAALQSATDALRAVTLTQQRSGSNSLSRAVVWLAVPAGIALAIHHFGWARVGWVTGETMQRSLQAVRNYVGTRISELSEALAARFDRLEGSLQETHESIQKMSITTAEVMAEVHSVAASLASLEERLTPLESNAATAAPPTASESSVSSSRLRGCCRMRVPSRCAASTTSQARSARSRRRGCYRRRAPSCCPRRRACRRPSSMPCPRS
jgi:hypothetical protein